MNLRSLAPFRSRSSAVARPPEVVGLGSLQQEIDRLLDDFARGFGALAPQGNGSLIPSIDIAETDKEIEITAELPGLERKDIDISLDGNVLTIRGEKKIEEEKTEPETTAQKGAQQDGQRGSQQSAQQNAQQGGAQGNQNRNYRLVERRYGVFYRVLELPPGIDANNVQATMQNGVLKIKIPKRAQNEAKRIEVKEAA
jgi:HSP20 family protein